MTSSSRRNSQLWPYPRHKSFEELLRHSNAAWFSERNYPVNPRMPYLLADWDNWKSNIIVPEVADYIVEEQKRRIERGEGFPLHKYIHHGLSSQAMVINLVGPLILHNYLRPLKLAFENAGIRWPQEAVTAKLEVEDRKIFNEDSGQPTSIDLVVQGGDGKDSLFIESKLVEHEFGGCSVFAAGDCDGRNPVHDLSHCYLHHLGRQYWVLLKKYGFLDGLVGSSPICPLAAYYQFFRELIFALESGGDFVLLYDERNPTFFCPGNTDHRGLMPFLMSFVPEKIKRRVHAISVQNVIKRFAECENLTWVNDFKTKYAMHDY